jgi:hypothetical protein
MKRLFLLLCKLGFHMDEIRGHSWVVVVLISISQGNIRAVKDALERDSTRRDAIATLEVDRGEIKWWRAPTGAHHLDEHCCPILVPIRVFAA